jgi:hypothetical protein
MAISLIVIDDFLTGAEEFRSAALRLSYPDRGKEMFPGRNSDQRLALAGLDQEISRIVGEPLQSHSYPSHGKCRLALAKDDEPGRIHVDPSHWSGILYLSKPEDCRGGTEFFRHIETGIDRVPEDLDGLAKIGFSSYEEFDRKIMKGDILERSKWERTMTVPMRFNRLILLRPWLFHTAGPGFGNSPENGRLVYLMFFGLVRR